MDTQAPYETNGSTVGLAATALDHKLPEQSVDDLVMIAKLTRRPVADVFAEAVEHQRMTALAKSVKPAVERTPKAPKAKP